MTLPSVTDLAAPHDVRSGVVVGFAAGVGLAGASGYPNDALKIGNPAYYSESGMMAGSSGTVFVMGALADYVNVGFWAGAGVFGNGDWRSSGGGGGLRIEAFPLVAIAPRWSGLSLFAQFGIGTGKLDAKAPGFPESDGTRSFVGAGVFHEWSLAHALGGHVSAGPSLEYDTIGSPSFERHGLVAGARVVFYGGP